MQILKNGCNVVRRRNAADETGGYILYNLTSRSIVVVWYTTKRQKSS